MRICFKPIIICSLIALFYVFMCSFYAYAEEITYNTVFEDNGARVNSSVQHEDNTVLDPLENVENSESSDEVLVHGIDQPVNNNSIKDDSIWYFEAFYSSVYDYSFYSSHNDDLVKAFGSDRQAYLTHFLDFGMSEGRSGNTTFDVLSYFNQYPDLRVAYGIDLKQYYMHYLNYGRHEGRVTAGCNDLIDPVSQLGGFNYSAVYDPQYYMEHNGDVVSAFTYRGRFVNDVAILNHFVTYGMNEGRPGNSMFRVINYYNRYSDIRNVFGFNLHDIYMHYLQYGIAEGRDTSDCPELMNWITSGWESVYDPQYYYNNNSDLKAIATKSTPQGTFIDDKWLWDHMYNYGAEEWRALNTTFDVVAYYNAYPDLRLSYGDYTKAYYIHYIQYGKKEGRVFRGVATLQGKISTYDGFNYSNVYNPDYYTSAYSDINERAHFTRRGIRFLNDGWAMWHFVAYGMNEERTGNGSFYPRSYWCQYSDVRRAFGSNWANLYRHYCANGKVEGRTGSGYWTLSGDVNFDNRLIALTRQFPTLWDSFAWVASFPYRTMDLWPSWGGWKLDIARQMLNDGSGNCYRYACLFMYMARALGYEADVRCGDVPLRNGGSAPHGWAEVYENGGTYICDPSDYRSFGGNGWFMTPYSNARINYRIYY